MSDFSPAFIDGNNLGTAAVRIEQAGELFLPTGEILACDPLMPTCVPFALTVDPGEYPVMISLADFEDEAYAVACAMIALSTEPPIRRQIATRYGVDDHEYDGYSVDSGSACFIDASLADTLDDGELGQDADSLYDDGVYQDDDDDMELPRIASDDELIDLARTIEDGVAQNGGWVNLSLESPPEANLVVFASGDGGGFYPSYWGYDAADEITCLVTNFGVLIDIE